MHNPAASASRLRATTYRCQHDRAAGRGPVLELLGQVHARKDAAYRDAWRKRGELLGIFPNIARKYDRLTVAMTEEEPATVEPLGGTVGDLCVYTPST